MTPRRFLLRSLVYHRGIHLAVVLGVAVGAAVLSGALLVGDSVRGSLRDLTLDRLGAIDHALVADRYFREELADDLAEATNFAYSFQEAAPAVLIRGAVESADSGSRASRVSIHGADERFWSFFSADPPDLGLREVLLNESLAREIGVQAGDAVLVRFQADILIPSESVMGTKTGNVRTLRLQVKAVIEDRGPGRFGLSPSQQLPYNAFVSLSALQRALEQEGRANALFVSGTPTEEGAGQLSSVLNETVQLDDLNLEVQMLEGAFQLATDRFVLDPASVEAAVEAAGKEGLASSRVLTYIANSITAGDREIPYSTVTAFEALGSAAFGPLTLSSGGPAPPLGEDEILLNDWAARDLGAAVGDEIGLTYYVVAPGGTLDTESHGFKLKGIVRLAGLASDRNLAPEFKGLTDADRMGEWDPPFPVDLGKIRTVDEEYWERYRTAPKAFVGIETARKLWTSRFGQFTSVRLAPVEGQDLRQAASRFSARLRERLDPAAYGLFFQPVKAQGLASSQGATDFSGLFIGFSLFLIVSAAMLVALLFRLGVERRSKEIGLLLATGQPISAIRRLLLLEGTAISLLGCVIGLPGAVGYGALMVYGLRTWWSAAVGGSFLELHVTTPSLIGGAVGSLLMMVVSIWLSVRKLERLSPRLMLAGALEEDRSPETTARAARRPRLIGLVSAVGAILLLALALTETIPQVAGFFGVGALLLVATLAFFRSRLIQPSDKVIRGQGALPLARLGARNGARYPTRSVLSAGLVASATFVIVTVAVSRHDVTTKEPAFRSGDGGFRLVAESDIPVYEDQLEIEGEGAPEMEIFPFRVKLGEDASCLNLYRPGRPTLLGATPEMIDRGGFAFQATLAETPEEEANPWRILNRAWPGGRIPVFGDSNSIQWILHLGLGEELEITDDQGRQRRLVIAGLMPRSLFQSQLIMSEENFLDLFPETSGYNFLLVQTGSEDAASLLEEHLADHGLDATRTADRLAGYLVVENTYLSTFQTLGGLGLLLGTLGLAVVMVRSVLERRAELALLQAVGFPGSSISWLVLAENAFLLVFGVVAGAATALLAVTPHLLSGMAEPPWFGLSATLLLVLAVGLLAGAAAVAASLRTPLTPALRRE